MLYSRLGTLAVLLILSVIAAPEGNRLLQAQNTPQDLPPLSYVCPMPQDAEVLETEPGKCRKCGMVLKPVRLDLAYSCPRHPFVMVGQPGSCPVDRQPLARITASVYWTCAGVADVRELTPGRCADGQPRVKAFERLAHGDHNPRHGGQFFMADDNWHHIEGTHPSRDTFRVFIYDDYTRAISPTGFAGKVIVLDDANREKASVPLQRGRVARTLEARIPPSPTVRVKLMLRFPNTDRDRVFDFAFQDITREPVETTTAVRSNPPQAAPSASPVPPPPPPPPMPASNAAAIVPAPAADQATTAFLSAAPLPDTTAGLLDELNRADQELRAVIDRGEFAVAWVPAMRAKDAALALEQRTDSPSASRPEVAQAVRQLVLSAWEIDAVGDLGDKDRITHAYAAFSAAATTIAQAHQPR